METGTDAVSRTSQTECEQGSGGENRRQCSRPVAHRQLARLGHCFAECLLCQARASTHGRAVGLIRRTAVCGPACTVVWQGRRGDPSPYADSRVCRAILACVMNLTLNSKVALITGGSRGIGA